MWFLNTSTKRLEFFNDEFGIEGDYAILSHRWAEEEVMFDEIHLKEAKLKQGYRKIEFACQQASEDGWDYVWIDTCCIDKRSSAELSEAINSMFRWYQNSRVCYVYLIDFEYDEESRTNPKAEFQNSSWWRRGWTLQELIAPEKLRFYDRNWRYYGDKLELLHTIHDITRIDIQVLEDGQRLHSMSVAKRMSWAAQRSTSREEDQAYSLLGIFNLNIPLLYGEGGVKAFYRLQEEIIRTSTFVDHSILAWMSWEGAPHLLATSPYERPRPANNQNLLAPSPYGFRHAENIVSWGLPQSETFTLTSSGLRLSLVTQPVSQGVVDNESLDAILNCRYDSERMSYISIWLEKRFRVDEGFVFQPRRLIDDIYDRSHSTSHTGLRLSTISSSEVHGEKGEITLARKPFAWAQFEDQVHVTTPTDLELLETFPAEAFDSSLSMLLLTTSTERIDPPMKGAYGALVLGRACFKADQFVLTIDRWTASHRDGSPRLQVGIFARSDVQDLQDPPFRGVRSIKPGKTREFEVPHSTKVQVTARCVNVSGELFWSIHVCQEGRVEVAEDKDV